MEGIPQDPDEYAERRRNMIAAITVGIEGEDYAFVIEIASHQNLLRPFEIVEYMDVKRRSGENPTEKRRWEEGLGHYLAAIEEEEFPEKEEEAINAVVHRLEFERAIDTDEVADEPRVEDDDPRSHYEGDDEDIDWRNDHFRPVGVDMKTLGEVSKTPVGKSVVRRAEHAISTGNAQYLKDAINVIQEYGSNDEAVWALEKALDKFAFVYAKKQLERAANTGNNDYLKKAIRTLDQYVSSEARVKAMLAELGLS